MRSLVIWLALDALVLGHSRSCAFVGIQDRWRLAGRLPTAHDEHTMNVLVGTIAERKIDYSFPSILECVRTQRDEVMCC